MTDDAAHRKQVIRRLYIATILCSLFMIVEIAGGLVSGSLAILSDAAHLFADLASFAVAIAASYLASLPATAKHTYGLKRTESLAALFSMASLGLVSVGLAAEALKRMVWPPEDGVDGNVMTIVAGIGVLVNIALAVVLGENHVHLPGGDHGHDHSHDHGGHGDCHGHGQGHHDDLLDTKVNHHHHHDDEDDDDDHSNGCCEHEHEEQHDHGHDHDHDHGHKHHDHDHDHGYDEPKHETSPLIVSTGGHEDHRDDGDHHHHHQTRQHRNVNLHAAYLHVLGDLAQSFAVFLGGITIWWKPEWHMIDPILTLGFCAMVLWSTIGVVRSSVAILLEEIPPGIEWRKVYDAISAVSNVYDVHDLHIWCISHGQTALSVHCTSTDDNAARNINQACLKFGIKHSTIQVDKGSCSTCDPKDCCTSKLHDKLS
mmetsp:Transcript_2253/g.5147  ORF Transcript_2253/g.5147 Transcript_2253/m.5147 type:complete len:427 (-) Transcript_2253:154-1434(-)